MKTSKTEKLITSILTILIIIFFTGHVAALINNGASLNDFSNELFLHIKEEPFDLQWHTVTFLASAMISSMCYLMMFVKTDIPKAEMKGIEHGSNDFQTNEELNQFLMSYTTPIYSHDLSEFKSKEAENERVPKKLPPKVDLFEDDEDIRKFRSDTKRIIAEKVKRPETVTVEELVAESEEEKTPYLLTEEIPEYTHSEPDFEAGFDTQEDNISPYYYETDGTDIFDTDDND